MIELIKRFFASGTLHIGLMAVPQLLQPIV